MQEGDGDEVLCHLKMRNVAPGGIFAKVNTNGDAAIPLYKFLKEKLNGDGGPDLAVNFEKFLIDKNGMPVKRYGATTPPMDIVEDIKKLM